jgi:Putative peptidoglycan binding domain
MKKVTSLLIGCSLALAGAALAQQPDEQQTPKMKQGAEKTHAAEAKPGAHATKPEATAPKQRGARNEPAAPKAQKPESTPKSAASAGTGANVSGQPATSATPGAEQHEKGMKAQVNTAAAAKKPNPQQVQQIKAQHTNFHAQPKPQEAPAVTFNQSYRIEGSDRWQGPQYEVFRSYHPERHDEGWYRSHYSRVELIGGGYYYLNNGYWYPAWGYNPSAEYYAYDGPIYVGHRAEPPDQVIADVQGELQQMGYYKGEADGLLGPLTRQALTAYQDDQGLTPTAAIDEPTLESLGMS